MRWLNLQAQGPYKMTSAERNEMRTKLLAMGKRRFEVGEWYRFNKDSLYLYVVSSHAPYEQPLVLHEDARSALLRTDRRAARCENRKGSRWGSCLILLVQCSRPTGGHGYTRAWVPLDMGFLSKDMKELWFMKMRFMGRRGLTVSEEYRYIEGSATEYEVRASAPLKYRDVLFFSGTQAIEYQELISREMVPDGEEEVNAPAVCAVVTPLPHHEGSLH